MKRILCAVLCILMILGTLSVTLTGAFAAGISTMPPEQDVISVVGLLEIMNGDNYGNLNLDNNVTRAEFIKMALCTSALKDKVNAGVNVAPFIDVRASHWAVGYVTTAVSNGYIKGYLDGTFKPDAAVTLEEAVTVMLRIMGYTELDSGKYPDTQLAKYEELEMDSRIGAVRGQALTRRECMYLMYNALCAKDKNGKVYCETLGYSADENGRIDYLALMSSKMEGPVVVYDDSYKSSINFDLDGGTVYRNSKKAGAADIQMYDVVYYNSKIKTAWCFTNKELGIVDSITVSGITSNSSDYSGAGAPADSIIVSGSTYKLGNKSVSYKFSAYGTFAPDDFVMLLLDKDGNVADAVLADEAIYETYADSDDDKVALINSTLKGPYVVGDTALFESSIPFPISEGKLYKGTKLIDKSEIRTNDVYYYSEVFRSVWIYRDTVTGIVKAIAPSSENPTSVTVGSKTYTLDSSEIKRQFSNFGTYEVDDFVTLLLGSGGTAVLATDGDIYDYANNNDDGVSYADLVNSTLKGPYIATDIASVEKEVPFPLSGAKIYDGTNQVGTDYIRANDVYYYSEVFESVWLYRDTATGFVKAVSPSGENPTSVTVGSKTYSLDGARIKQQFSNFGTYEVDDFVTLLLGNGGTAVLATDGDIYEYANSNDDGVSYADLVNQSMKGPVIVGSTDTWKSEIPFDVSSATVYKKNSEVTAEAISEYDVLYYSVPFESVWIYSDKATGVLETVSPNKISPTSVVISGSSYSLESTGASFKVSNLGSFVAGDTVTVLLGKNGGIIDVIAGSEMATASYGFVTGFSEKEFTRPNGTTYSAKTVEIIGIDTKNYSYQFDGSYLDKGDFVSVTYREDKPYITSASSGTTSAQATNINSLIAGGKISDDAILLDVYITGDSDSLENKSVDYVTIYPARLSGVKLQSSEIYYADVRDGEIKALVLKNFTGDIHSYGVVTAERSGGSVVYKTIMGGKEQSVEINTAYGDPQIGPARFVLKAGKYIVTNLDYVKVGKGGFFRGYCVSGGESHNYSSNVEYYIKVSAREFTISTYEDIANGNYTIKAYYDKPEVAGGRIRVIIAE